MNLEMLTDGGFVLAGIYIGSIIGDYASKRYLLGENIGNALCKGLSSLQRGCSYYRILREKGHSHNDAVQKLAEMH